MSKSSLKAFLAVCLAAMSVTPLLKAQITSWNAYSNFYLSPTAAGWGGATNPSAAGAAWGYYMGNVNGSGFPATTGTYLSASQIYKFSSYDPLGAGGPVYSTSGWAATGGAGFAYYSDNVDWGAGAAGLHSSLGSYPTPWFDGAPGFSQGFSNLMWMQSVWLGGASLEGIASMVTWTAPYTANYTFTGLFVAGDQSGNGASVAIIDSLSASLLSRASLAPNASTSFSFTNSYNAGDIVQFQVGSDFKTGNAVGLQLDIQAVPEPSTMSLAGFGLAAVALYSFRRRRSH
jgi:hypothetical protein